MKIDKASSRRILFVIGTLGKGGAETQLLMLMRELKENAALRPEVFVLEAQGVLLPEVQALGIKIHDGGYSSVGSKSRRVLLLLRAFLRLWWLLISLRPCVVNGFLPLANFMSAVAGRLAFIQRIVTSRRALNTHQDRYPIWRIADKLSARLSHVVTANAHAVKNDTLIREGGRADKIKVIPNGVDPHRFELPKATRANVRLSLGFNETHLVLVIVANLIVYKGHRELIEALAKLKSSFSNMRLLVVGEDRGIGEDLQKLSRKLDVADQIQWLGLRHDIPELLAASDIYVSASHEEGFSNSLLEALVAGKAAVATNVGGNPEMLEFGRLGVLVPSKSSWELAEGIRLLATNEDRRLELGRKAMSIMAAKYGSDQMCARFVAEYF